MNCAPAVRRHPVRALLLVVTSLTASACTVSPQHLRNDMTLASEAVPHGTKAEWAYKPRVGAGIDVDGYTAATAWGQVFECSSGNPQPKARAEIRNLELWLKSKRTGKWTRLQDSTSVDGGAFLESYASNTSKASGAVKLAEGGTSVAVGGGWNYHFWPVSGRKAINPNDVAAWIVSVRARLTPGSYTTTGKAPCYTLSVGADYWKTLKAVWDGSSANQEIAIGRFKKVQPTWRLYTLSTTQTGTLPDPTSGSAAELR